MDIYKDPKRELVKAARRLHRMGMVAGSGGNLSVKVGERIFITPTGLSFRDLNRPDIAEVGLDGRWLAGPLPSSEWRMHVGLLRLIPGIGAVCHVHGLYSIAFSILMGPGGDKLPQLTPGLVLLGPVPILPQLPPGSGLLAEKVTSAIGAQGARAVLLENHGLVTVGKDLGKALDLAEEIEAGLRLWFLVRDRPRELSAAMRREILETYKKGPA
jgi:ribulose-5-phosphate 4-epimerase/fuculose-1-phosphate aldolase